MNKPAVCMVICVTIIIATVSGLAGELQPYQVIEVERNNTLKVSSTSCGKSQIKLIGVSIPGRNKQFFNKESTTFLDKLVQGQIWVEVDNQKCGPHNRLFGYVYLTDDKRPSNMINAMLLSMGYAKVLYYYPQNNEYMDLFVELEDTAQRLQLGIWNEKLNKEPTGPSCGCS